MKKIALLLSIIFFLSKANAQFVHVIKADSVLITNDSCTAELNLENSTKHIKGFLYNKGNGRTEFRKFVKLNDTTFVMGGDTLLIGGAGASRNFANSDLTFNASHIHNGNQKQLYLDNFTYIDLKSNKVSSTASSRLKMDSSGAFLVHSDGASSLRRSFIESDTNWLHIGHLQPSQTGPGNSYVDVVVNPPEWGPGFDVSVGSNNSGSNNLTSSLSLSYNGSAGLTANGDGPNKKASLSVNGGSDGFSPTVYIRVDTTDGSAAGIWSTFMQTPRFFEFQNLYHSTYTPLDFRLITLPVSVDTTAQKPLTVDSAGRVYKRGSWPTVSYTLQQVTNNGNTTTNTIKPYPSALPVGTNTDSVVVWSASDSLLKKIGSKQTFAQTSTVTVSATDVQTTLTSSGAGSLTIPAASWFVGKTYKVVLHGTYSTSSTNPASLTIKIKLGTTVVAQGSFTLAANKTDVAFECRNEFTCRATGASGTVFSMGMMRSADNIVTKLNNGTSPTSVTLSTSQDLNITAQLSNNVSGNSVSAYLILLEAMN